MLKNEHGAVFVLYHCFFRRNLSDVDSIVVAAAGGGTAVPLLRGGACFCAAPALCPTVPEKRLPPVYPVR